MSDPLLRVKPAVRAAAAYTLAARRAPVKINQNENPFDLPEAARSSPRSAGGGPTGSCAGTARTS
jgi:hypothetical protein